MTKLGFYVVFISFASAVLSREILPKTTTLDISASIRRTVDVLHFNPNLFQEEEEQDNEEERSGYDLSSSFFSIKLRSRDTLLKSTYKDYRTLTIDRLKRDSARVESILTRLDVEPLLVESQQDGTRVVPVISGLSYGSGEYFSRVGVGSPPEPQYLALDTGSDITWLQCAPCMKCYNQDNPIFEPSSSTSFSRIPCGTEECNLLDVPACSNRTCRYQVIYGAGSFTVGEFVTETLTFGNLNSTRREDIYIGCGHDNRGLFHGSAGVLALGPGSLSLPSQLYVSAFSYCLVDQDSSWSSTLQFGSQAEPADAITAPLRSQPQYPTFYYVGLIGISVNGRPLDLPQSVFNVNPNKPSGVIIDSGTTVTRLPTDVYNTLRDEFDDIIDNLPYVGGFAQYDTCYDLSSISSSTVSIPAVAFLFPGKKSLVLPAKNYLVPVGDGTFCFAFAPTNSSLSIIGNLQLQGTRVSFNIDNSVVGFSPNKC